MPTPQEPQLRRLIAELMDVYPSAHLEFERLPSGACFLDVRIGERMFDLEYHPGRRIGVSEIKDETPPFTGHDQAFQSLEEAIEFFKGLVAEAAHRESNEPIPALHDRIRH